MKLPFLILSAVLLVPPVAARAQEPAPVSLRVLTYNIHHGEGRDGRLDIERIAEVIRGAQPDIVALQEVDRGTTRVNGMDQVAELARLLDMHAEFGKAMDFSGGEYGVAVLSRWTIQSAENRPLPHIENHEPRTALTARIKVGRSGPWVRVTSTHLDETRDTTVRAAQVERLIAALSADREPGILAGDFNARLETGVMQTLDAVWSNAVPEYPQQAPGTGGGFGPPAGQGAPGQGGPPAGALGPDGRPLNPQRRGGPRGDFVLYRPAGEWRVVESRAVDDFTASDHRPVLTVLEWAGNG